MLIRRELITRMGKLLLQDQLIEKIDRIPLEMFPRHKASLRCCIHKERAVLKYKLMALMGFDVGQEEDELRPLSSYASQALERTEMVHNVMTVVDEACSSCVKNNYVVTNVCRGCVARPCMLNCPKQAISFVEGRAHINQDDCVNCGICMKECPYHAIIFQPIPCEEACPVNAIKKDEHGVEHIDEEKCIHCGKCMTACPFGAILEKSQVLDIIRDLKDEKKQVVAILAPAIIGQFKADFGQIIQAVYQMGFNEVLEVSEGAVKTADMEAAELKERLADGAPFMTSSCCPAYIELVDKHLPGVRPFVSDTKTPMHYSAEQAKTEFPDCKTVFIGPCIAKRNEAVKDPFVDYVMTFEEFGSLLIATGLDVGSLPGVDFGGEHLNPGRWFAATGGVSKAIRYASNSDINVKEVIIDGFSRRNINQIKMMAKGKCAGNLVEIMACEGGCLNGAGVISHPGIAKKQLDACCKERKER